ncbi:MAG TPA: hypothetical protein VF773_11235 [Verrucomicrobiae bacterium]
MAIGVVGGLMDEVRFPAPTQEESDALDWNYWGALLPYSAQITIWWIFGLLTLVGVIGFIFFQGWSRWLLLGCLICSVLTSPLSGLYVARGLSEGIAALGGLLFVFPFVLSFYPPCSDYFSKRVRKGEEPGVICNS